MPNLQIMLEDLKKLLGEYDNLLRIFESQEKESLPYWEKRRPKLIEEINKIFQDSTFTEWLQQKHSKYYENLLDNSELLKISSKLQEFKAKHEEEKILQNKDDKKTKPDDEPPTQQPPIQSPSSTDNNTKLVGIALVVLLLGGVLGVTLSDSSDEISSLSNQISKIESELSLSESKLDDNKLELNNLKMEFESDLELLITEKSNLEMELIQVQTDKTNLENQIKGQKSDFETQILNLNEQINLLNGEITKYENILNMTDSMWVIEMVTIDIEPGKCFTYWPFDHVASHDVVVVTFRDNDEFNEALNFPGFWWIEYYTSTESTVAVYDSFGFWANLKWPDFEPVKNAEILAPYIPAQIGYESEYIIEICPADKSVPYTLTLEILFVW